MWLHFKGITSTKRFTLKIYILFNENKHKFYINEPLNYNLKWGGSGFRTEFIRALK